MKEKKTSYSITDNCSEIKNHNGIEKCQDTLIFLMKMEIALERTLFMEK